MAEFQSKFTGQEVDNAIDKLRTWIVVDGTYPTVTISGVTYAVIWKSIPVSGTPCYGIGLHPTTGRIYEIYYNGSSYTATALDTDTKNTAGSTNSTSKLFLVGAGSQGTNPQTFSNSQVYTQDGKLYSNNTEVSVYGHTHKVSDITDLYKQEYNLGYYDTITANSDGSYTITRQTGYLKLDGVKNKFSEKSSSTHNGLYYNHDDYVKSNALKPSNTEIVGDIICNLFETKNNNNLFNYNEYGVGMYTDGAICVGLTTAITTIDEANAYLVQNPISIQYKLATATTEKVEKNHYARYNERFILDHNKSEAERSCNLLNTFDRSNIPTDSSLYNATLNSDGSYTSNATSDSRPWTYANSDFRLYLTKGTYYFSVTGTISTITYTQMQIIDTNNNRLLMVNSGNKYKESFTLTSDTYVGVEVKSYDSTNLKLMLNYGDHPYPYQTYNSKAHITNNEADFLKTESDRSANLFNPNNVEYGSINNDGTNLGNGTDRARSFYIPVLSNTYYSIRTNNSELLVYELYQYDSNKSHIEPYTPISKDTFTFLTRNNTYYIRILFRTPTNTDFNLDILSSVMLNEGSTPLPYQQYEGKVVHEKGLGEKLNSYVDISTRQEINALKRFNNGIALKRDDTGIFGADDGANIAIKFFGRDLFFYGKSGVENYVANAIFTFAYSGENNCYQYTFPQKNGTIALTSDIPTTLPDYNLGAYDTITANSDGTYTITRQTGYTTIEDSNILSTFTSGGSKVFAAETNIILPNAVTDWNLEFGISNIGYKVRSLDGNWIFDKTIGGIGGQTVKIANNDFTTIDQFKALCPIKIQYKMTISYTEKVEANHYSAYNQDFILEHNKSEAERSANVFDINKVTIGNGYDYTATASDWVKAIDIPVEPNTTYTTSSIISRYAFNHGNIVADYNKNTITTGSDTKTLSLFIYVGSYSGTARAWFSNYMLNKGSIAYPYQPYNSKAHITNYEADYLKSEAERSANLFDVNNVEYGSIDENGSNMESGHARVRSFYIPVLPNTYYSISANNPSLLIYELYQYDSNKSYIAPYVDILEDTYTFLTKNNTYYIRILFRNTSNTDFNLDILSSVMLNEGSVALPYQPYNQNKHITNNEALFLKAESERSANVKDLNYNNTNNGISLSIVNNKFTISGTNTKSEDLMIYNINLNPGTYTISIQNVSGTSSDNFRLVVHDHDWTYQRTVYFNANSYATFTVSPDDTNPLFLQVYGPASNNTINCSGYIMLNKGSEPLPYQPYEGKVVHEKELGEKLNSYVDTSTRQEINALKRFNNGVALKRDDTGIFQTDDGVNLAIKCFGRAIHFYGKSGVESYVANAILSFAYSGENNSYEYNFPTKTGTIALTNDFKTINGNSIVGSGDISIAPGIYTKVATNQRSYSLAYGKTYKIKMNSNSYAYCSAISNAKFYGTFDISNFTIEYTSGASSPSGVQMTLPQYSYTLCSSGAQYTAQSSNTIKGFSNKYNKVSITLTANSGTFDVYELN